MTDPRAEPRRAEPEHAVQPIADPTSTLRAAIDAARARADAAGRPVVLVHVVPRDDVDPLAELREARVGDYGVFWAEPGDAFAVAGLGPLVTIETSGPERFERAGARAIEVLADAVIVRDAAAPPWSPRWFGGFAFGDEASRDPVWAGFAAAEFVLHRRVVGRLHGDGFEQRACLVEPGADAAIVAMDLDSPAVLPHSEPRRDPPPAHDGRTRFTEGVRRAVAAIEGGGLEKVVLVRSETRTTATAVAPVDVLERLGATQPACVRFGFGAGGAAFVGATPEWLVRTRGATVQTMALAGSAPRGADDAEDRARMVALTSSRKEAGEHRIVVDAVLDALRPLCERVEVARGPAVMTLANIHHLKTGIAGRARPGTTGVALARALHPTPAVGGRPRDAAATFIDANESDDRGWFAGAVGWIDIHGDVDLAVALRSAVIDRTSVTTFAGAGIVAASDPDRELAETDTKMDAMRKAIEGADA